MDAQNWWLRFGNYSPGSFNLPHMGEVIADYRKRRYRTQEEFAIAARDKIRNVQEWETQTMMTDTRRRIFLARLLQIPPALVGLTWHQVYSDYSSDDYNRSLTRLPEAVEEDAYYIYEDVLTYANECLRKGGAPQLAYRLARRLARLKELVPLVPAPDREAWQTLLVHFYCLCGSVTRIRLGSGDQSIGYFMEALELATQIDDNELICHVYQCLANGYEWAGNLPAARDAIQAALTRAKKIHAAVTPLKGTVYLRAASIQAQLAGSSQKEQAEAREMVDKATKLLYKGIPVEDDGMPYVFNLAAVNHEKAKLLLEFARQQRGEGRAIAQREADVIHARLQAALNTVPPDLTIWQMHFHVTEAKMYLAQHDIEASASASKKALQAAQVIGSQSGLNDVQNLYTSLRARGPGNPYVDNLGVVLGLF